MDRIEEIRRRLAEDPPTQERERLLDELLILEFRQRWGLSIPERKFE